MKSGALVSPPKLYPPCCITFSKSPSPSFVYIRLCKHGKRFLLLNYNYLVSKKREILLVLSPGRLTREEEEENFAWERGCNLKWNDFSVFNFSNRHISFISVGVLYELKNLSVSKCFWKASVRLMIQRPFWGMPGLGLIGFVC